jgi:serine/threonine protein kinase/tetratricopeptide (TPR) repeat protein/uncharacterized protein YgiM (DUF1202 family)
METQVLEGLDGGKTQIITGEERGRAASAGAMLQPGEIVAGYTVKERLPASGGEAEVYVCTKDGEPYALKYYYTRKTETEVIDKIKKITHPGIVSIMDSGEYKGRFFTILEYAAGGALDDRQPDGSFKYLPVSDEKAAGIVRDAIEAFEAFRKAGIIHRDIKPGNLLYKNAPDQGREAGGILIGDFGIASVFEAEEGMSKHLTETGARTEGYAAPEVYSGVIGQELDYYALGVTLWVLLTGEEPFVDEEGRVLNINQIMLDTIQGKTADSLLSRSPQISPNMKKLIRGLLSVRHDKRWGYDEVKRHLNGEDVEVFHEERTLPVVEIGGESCASYKEIAEALLKHPEEGKKFVFQEKLSNYLIKIDQNRSDQIDEVIDRYSADKREDEGTVFVAYSLCPNLPFAVDHGRGISGFIDILKILEDDPQALLPYLKERERGFYAYLEVMNLAEEGKRVKEIVESTSGGIRAAARIIAAFQGNVITPFQDGVNDGYTLSSIDDLAFLPDYLKDRALIFVERNCGLLPAWIENLNGRDIDDWLSLLAEWREPVEEHGAWDYFNLFLQGKDSAVLVDYLVKNRDTAAIQKAVPWFRENKQYAAANKLIDRVWPEYYKEGNWTVAREILTYIDEKHKEGLDRPYDFYLAHIGLCLYQENQIDKALEYLNKALSMNKAGSDLNSVPYVYAAGCIFMRKGDMSGAVAAFNDAVSLKRDLPQALLRKGACLLSLKNYNEAAASCSQLLAGQFSGPAFESTARARAHKIRALSYAEMENMQDKASSDQAKANNWTETGAIDIFDDYLSSIDAIIEAFDAEKNARQWKIWEQKRQETEREAERKRLETEREAEEKRLETKRYLARRAREKFVFSPVFLIIYAAAIGWIAYSNRSIINLAGYRDLIFGVDFVSCILIGSILGSFAGAVIAPLIVSAIGAIVFFVISVLILSAVPLGSIGIVHTIIMAALGLCLLIKYIVGLALIADYEPFSAYYKTIVAPVIFVIAVSVIFSKFGIADDVMDIESYTATVVSGEAVIRSAPEESDANVIAPVEIGSVFSAIEILENDWVLVEAGGKPGYISRDQVNLRNAEKDFLIASRGDIVKYVGKESNVVIPAGRSDSTIAIKEKAFHGKHLTNVIIPSSVTAIEDRAFMDNQLTGVSLPGGVTSVGDEAFLNNPITTITIGANVALGWGSNPLDPFGNGFRSYYIDSGERPGTYEYTGGEWIWRGGTVAVRSNAANIRSAPDSSKNNVITTLRNGDILTVTGSVNNGWLPVEVDGQAGYVSADLVELSGAR